MKQNTSFLVFLAPLLVLCSADRALCQKGRETWQPPEAIMDSVGVKPGMIIGEPGAGRGYLTFYLAKRVGDKGRIYANDIDKSSLDYTEMRA
jgi:ubiquinone/menaquinone biosynthesis C-methylase UbiE